MRRALLVLAVVALLALAGCGGLGDGLDPQTSTVPGAGPTTPGGGPATTTGDGGGQSTPTQPPPTTTPTPPSSVEYPAHMTVNGLADQAAFSRAFAAALATHSVAINRTGTWTGDGGTRTYTDLQYNATTDRLGYRFSIFSDAHGPGENTHRAFVNETAEYRWNWYRSSEGEYLVTEHAPNATRYLRTQASELTGLLARSNLSMTGTTTTEGITVVAYELTGYETVDNGTFVRYPDASGTVRVDERGLIREYELSLPEATPSGRTGVTFSLSVGAQRVATPPWAGAVNATADGTP